MQERWIRWLSFPLVGCCVRDGPGKGSGLMGPAGTSSRESQRADCSESWGESLCVPLARYLTLGQAEASAVGSQLKRPSGQAKKPLDDPASAGPVQPSCRRSGRGAWQSWCLKTGEPKALGPLDTLLALTAWDRSYRGTRILTPCQVGGSSRDLLGFCSQAVSTKHCFLLSWAFSDGNLSMSSCAH